MVRSSGRLLTRAALSLCAAGYLAATHARPALAQSWDDEVIVDPELAGDAPASGMGSGGSDEEVIEDPELSGSASSSSESVPSWDGTSSSEEADDYDPMANTGIAKLEIAAQFGFDLYHEGDREIATALEDAYETRFRFGAEVEFRRSRKLRIHLGTRLDLFWAVPSQNDAYVTNAIVANEQGHSVPTKVVGPNDVVRKPVQRALDQDRFEIDIIPTAAYIDWTIFDGGHLRMGTQPLAFGRMVFMSGTDILTVYDLRPQPTLNPASLTLAQPAVRFDWDITQSLTLQLAYVPWFMPNLTRPDRDKYKTTALSGVGSAAFQDNLEGIIDPSFQTKSSQANLRFVAPPPDFTTPQGQAKLTLRTRRAIVSMTGGAAIEKLPSVYYTPSAEMYAMCNPYATPQQCLELQAGLGVVVASNHRVMDTQYHRYYLVGGDLSFDLGPVNTSLEVAFSPQRHLYAATRDGSRLPIPNTTEPIRPYVEESDSNLTDRSIRKGVPIVQGGLHVEYLRGQSLMIAGEFFWVQATQQPHDENRWWLGFHEKLSAMIGGGMVLSYAAFQGNLRLDLSAFALNGPGIAVMPHIEYRILEDFFVDAGVQIFQGIGDAADPGINGSTMLNFGGLMGGSDQVFVGFRWLP